MARFLRYVPAGLLCVATLSAATSAWARPQNADQSQPAPAPPQSPPQPFALRGFTFSTTPAKRPDLSWLWRQSPQALSAQCFTMRIVPVDPNVDKGISAEPKDRQTDFTARIVPAPPCVVPGVAPGTAPDQFVPPLTRPGSKILPTQRGFPGQGVPAPAPTIPGQGGDASR